MLELEYLGIAFFSEKALAPSMHYTSCRLCHRNGWYLSTLPGRQININLTMLFSGDAFA
jgi:hypothetical protein